MKRTHLLLAALLGWHATHGAEPGVPQKTTLAILPFDFHGQAALNLDWIRNGFPELLESAFSQPGYQQVLRLVDRNRLNQSLQEMELGQSGFIDEKATMRAGNMVGAEYIVSGSLVCMNDQSALITAKLVKVETSELATVKTEGPIAELHKSLPDTVAAKLFLELQRLMASRAKPGKPATTDSLKAQGVVSESISATAKFYLGLEHMKRREYEPARAALEEAVRLDPQFARAYVNLGVVHLQQLNRESAREYFLQALQIFPNSELAYYNLGLSYAHQEEWGEAIKAFEKARRIQPDNCETLIELGKIYYKRKDYGRAIEHYRQALAVDSLYLSAYYYLGVAHWQQKKFEAARRAWEKALSREEPFFKETIMLAHKSLGFYFLNEAKAPAEAVTHYQAALRRAPPELAAEKKGELYSELGKAYLQNREPNEAVKYLETASSLLPNDPATRMNYALALLGAQQHDRALIELETLARLDERGSYGQSARELLKKVRGY